MKHYQNPFGTLTRLEWGLWLCSLAAITIGFLSASEKDYLTLAACLVGVTSLIFVAKGDPMGQGLAVVFAIMYSVISFTFRYYGEMITYMGMTAPIAFSAMIAWFRNPYKEGENEVKIAAMTRKKWIVLLALTCIVTFVFYFILDFFNTTNLVISTVSIATSFLASSLTFLRSPLYGLAYGSNDIVLVIMWIMATAENPSYLPMVICFAVFLANDCYGFLNWQRMKTKQAAE